MKRNDVVFVGIDGEILAGTATDAAQYLEHEYANGNLQFFVCFIGIDELAKAFASNVSEPKVIEIRTIKPLMNEAGNVTISPATRFSTGSVVVSMNGLPEYKLTVHKR